MENKQLPRDVFLYVLMIAVLAWSAGSLGSILFQIIDKYIPASTALGYYGGSALKFPVASLIVMFPVLVWVLRFLRNDMKAHPEKRELKVRKWLLYLALFVSALIALGDLVALVLGLLDGNTALGFLLKVLAVFWISGSTFYYFLKDLHDEESMWRTLVGYKVVAVVVIALVVSLFLVVGQRAYDRDSTRVNSLTSLEWQVLGYWQAKNALPATLADLHDGTIADSGPGPVDPVTGKEFEYRPTGSKTYEFCAVFETSSQDQYQTMPVDVYGKGAISAFSHGVGRQCFDGSIDPDRYPPAVR